MGNILARRLFVALSRKEHVAGLNKLTGGLDSQLGHFSDEGCSRRRNVFSESFDDGEDVDPVLNRSLAIGEQFGGVIGYEPAVVLLSFRIHRWMLVVLGVKPIELGCYWEQSFSR